MPIVIRNNANAVDSNGIAGNNGSYAPSISADGRYVAFHSGATNLVAGDTNGNLDIFVHDTQTGVTTRVSVDSSGVEGDDYSQIPSISADGRYVAFYSDATNLVTGDTNGAQDIFVHDTQTGVTTRFSVDSNDLESNNGSYNPSISADGRYVAFDSFATNLVADDTNGRRDVFSTATNFAVASTTENIPSTSVMGLLSLMTGVVAFGLIRRRKSIK
ncbi:TolB family protein [Ostreibacterium oceani]|uniref:Uncharacterized protein n=1 Tax=Ostreibacterium oceani TaxID=2654998 RepID=A0A6N7EYJ0_9GAMM|nr:PD40 domain-containing protein [Ostreibacterium oceani]MPV87013.1 hypothetical protein [Ostreibacterium oceani]